jgi:hypothetical protein
MNKAKESLIISRLNAVMMWVLVVDTCLLLLPFDMFSKTIATGISEIRFVLWLILIVASSNFISQGLIMAFSALSKLIHNKMMLEQLTKAVTCLDFSERAVLREFILQRKSVLNLPVNEPTVRNLLTNGILAVAENTVDVHGKSPIMINVDARPFITYRAVGLSKGKMSEEQIEQIMNARPKYARNNY